MSEAATVVLDPLPGGRHTRPPVALLPVLSLLDRLRATSRLGVVIALLLVPGLVATAAYTYSERNQISFSSSERDGVQMLRPTLAAMASLVAGGDFDLSAVEAAVNAHPELGLDDNLSAINAAAQGKDLRVATSRVEATQAFGALVTEAGNASNLILDPDLDSFYVMDAQVVQIPRALMAAAEAAATAGQTGSAELVASRAVLAGELSGAAEALRSDLKTAIANTKSPGLDGRLTSLTTLADAIATLAAALTKSLGTPGADASAVATAAGPAATAAENALNDLLRDRIDTREFALARVLVVTALGFLLAFWLAVAVWWRSRRDVTLVVAAVTAIASRDTTDHELPEGRDEFGDIGRALRLAREHLGEQDAALSAAQRQQELQSKENHAQLQRAEKQTRQLAQQIIAESITALIGELSEVATGVEAVRAAAEMIHERVGNADEVLRSVLTHASSADEVTTALGTRLQRVAGMTKLIASVADQTKMLALNATIEAARAGVAGEGFSVVASEVKELAATTARSTEEITGTIQALEREAGAVSTTITAMTSGINGVDQATAALLGAATEQQVSVANMDRRIASAMERVRGMSDLSNRMERRDYERVPITGTAWFVAGGARYELAVRDVSEGGLRGTLLAGGRLDEHQSGRLELPAPGLPPVDAEVIRGGGGPGAEVAVRFDRLSQAQLARLREFLDAAR